MSQALDQKIKASNILASIGQFYSSDLELFENYTIKKCFNKNDVLLKEGEVCQSLYFIQSGAFFQSQSKDIDDVIIDLHLEGEWMFNHQSLIEQIPSKTTIKAFKSSEAVELNLVSFHALASKSTSFCNSIKF